METIELRAAAAKLRKQHKRFTPCFGRRECQGHSLGYLKGLLLAKDDAKGSEVDLNDPGSLDGRGH